MLFEFLFAFQAASASARAPAQAITTDCRIFDLGTPSTRPVSVPALTDLYVACGQKVARLGMTASYISSFDQQSKSIVVLLQEPNRTRVVLAYLDGSSVLHVDDITGGLAKLSGRAVDAVLRKADLDLSRFADDGVVSIAKAQASEAEERVAAQLDLRALIAAERSFGTKQ